MTEANAAKRARRRAVESHPERLRRGDSIRHDPFPASFVDRRARNVHDGDLKPALARRDCRRKTGRSATDYNYICRSLDQRHREAMIPGGGATSVCSLILARLCDSRLWHGIPAIRSETQGRRTIHRKLVHVGREFVFAVQHLVERDDLARVRRHAPH